MIGELLERLKAFRSSRPLLYHSFILCLYGILTAMLTYPVVADLAGSIAGEGDAWQVLYILWYTKQALLGGDPNLTMTYTNYLFYPHGVTTFFYAFSLFNQLLGIPLQMIFGLVTAFNVLWLLSFILAGYGAFLLARYLTGNDAAAFISGIVYAYSPYHFAQALQHVGATTIEWIPFCALFIVKALKERSLKDAALAGIFFILVAMSDSQYMMFMALFVALIFIYEAFATLKINFSDRARLKVNVDSLKGIFAIGIIFGLIALLGAIPLNYGMLQIATSSDNYLKADPSLVSFFSGDLAGFFTPSSLHPLFGGWTAANVYTSFTGNVIEYTTFVGFTVLVLAILAVVVLRRDRSVIFWALSSAFFALMTLGPTLHFFGPATMPFSSSPIPMPYQLVVMLVPFLGNSRTVSRFDVMVMLSMAVLAGYGISLTMRHIRARRGQAIAVCVIVVLILFEFLSTPAISLVDRPAIYEQLGLDNGHYAVLEVPASYNYDCGIKAEYYATISGKPMVGGQVPRNPPDVNNFEMNTPLIDLLSFSGPFEDIFHQDTYEIGNYVLNYYNIGYVLLHKDHMDNMTLEMDRNLLNVTLDTVPYYEDQNIIAYKVGNASPRLFMVAGKGWSQPQSNDNQTWRWAANVSTIDIISPGNGTYDLSMNVTSLAGPQTIKIFVNGENVADRDIDIYPADYSVPIRLNAGDNVVEFSSTGGSIPFPGFVNTDTPAGSPPGSEPATASFVFEDISATPPE